MECVFLDLATLGADIDFTAFAQLIPTQFYQHTQQDEALIQARIGSSSCVISNKVRISSATLAACPNLKLILTAATGVDHIDIAAAKAAGIPVCNTRNYARASVTQHVFASILYFANQQHRYQALMSNKTWSRQALFCLHDYPITELAGKTLGIIGYGNLGQGVATLGQAFQMNLLICEHLATTSANAATVPPTNTPARVPLQQLLANSDFITLHCPLTATTRHLISTSEFALMKKRAILINTARGDIVDTEALLIALEQNTIGGAALDVFSAEPLPENNPLLVPRENLLITPHIAWASLEARQQLIRELEFNLKAWLEGSLRNQVS